MNNFNNPWNNFSYKNDNMENKKLNRINALAKKS